MKIKKLNKNLINKIAAGEVVDGPYSVIKELLENSIDAKASSIIVELQNAGMDLIRVIDNGTGMKKDDLMLAFERYATSKIDKIGDLENISSLGFRGEALPSIASISEIEAYSRTKDDKVGQTIKLKNGKIMDKHPRGGSIGTNITVKNIFYNVPARKKFMKSQRSESLKISEYLQNFFLSYPNIMFKVIKNGKENIFLEPASLKQRFLQLFHGVKNEDLIDIIFERDGIMIKGIVSNTVSYKKNKKRIFISVNGRIIKDNLLTYYFRAPYESFLMKGQFPQGIINMTLEPQLLDVNVHPRKTEVKFLYPTQIRNTIFTSIYEELKNFIQISGNNILDVEHVDFEVKHLGKQGEFEFSRGEKKEFRETVATDISRESFDKTIEIKGKIFSYINTIFNTYILLSSKDNFILMDQHAADERVLFEKIESAYKTGKILSQELLFPLKLDTALDKHHLEFLEKIGFSINTKNDTIEAVPVWLNERKQKEKVDEIISSIIDEKHDFMDWIKQIACKSAVKGGRTLPFPLIKSIIISLFQCKNPTQCPHGRPTYLIFSQNDLEKMFKRKV
ncbi:DNA mismatch repair endonuclease MutL [bacterium]|nr:DNA mismatch repair endonuclease MutL [bacterium]